MKRDRRKIAGGQSEASLTGRASGVGELQLAAGCRHETRTTIARCGVIEQKEVAAAPAIACLAPPQLAPPPGKRPTDSSTTRQRPCSSPGWLRLQCMLCLGQRPRSHSWLELSQPVDTHEWRQHCRPRHQAMTSEATGTASTQTDSGHGLADPVGEEIAAGQCWFHANCIGGYRCSPM